MLKFKVFLKIKIYTKRVAKMSLFEPEYLSKLKKIVLINSFTQNKTGVDQVGEIFIDWFEKLGFSANRFIQSNIGNHLLFSSSVKKDVPRILLVGHLDTVFDIGTFDTWNEDQNWVYGAGVCDMKGGLIVIYEALKNIKNKKFDIFNIDILLVSDEETGSDNSKLLTSKIAQNYKYAFVFEASGQNMEVVTGRKGVGTFFIDIQGKPSHAGNFYSQGVDANLELSHKLQKLVALTDLSKGTTVNVGKIEGGIGANTISPKSKITFEIRYKTNIEKQRLLNKIDEIVQTQYVKGTLSVLSGGIQRDVMETSSESLKLVENLSKILNKNISTEERGGVSDANILASNGVITLDGFGPYGDGDHTIQERALKSSFTERINDFTNILEYFLTNQKF
jgi:glutamate carboxypeptidase